MRELVQRARRLRHPGSVWRLRRYVFDLGAGSSVGADTSAAGPTLVEVNQADLDDLRATSPELTDRKYAQLQDRIGSPGITAYLIRDADGTWAGYCHLAFRRFDDRYLNHVVRLRRRQTLFVDDAVFRSHRKRGLHTFSVQRRRELARGRGMRTGVVVINDKNTASIASYRHVGIRPVRRLYFVRPFRLMIQLPWRRS